MAAETVMAAPPNALIFISDASGGGAPEFIANIPVRSTDTVISVNCLPDMDGETRVTLGPAAEVGMVGPPVFDGTIKTPTRGVLVSTVEHEEVLAAAVPSLETRIRIWTSRTVDPDDIVIAGGG
jgi:hypothetical protein